MPTTSKDIVFDCPRCRGPIMVEMCHVGAVSECPHCFDEIEIPEVSAVNKEKFMEPPGLRRILQEVQDREWEHMRRKLRTAKAQIIQLEKHAVEAKEAAAGQSVAEADALRKQLAELGDKFVLANKAFTAGRKQHDVAVERLRHDLEAAREETHVLQKKKDLPIQTLLKATTEVEELRQQAASASDEIGGLKAALEWAKCEAAELREKLALAEAEFDAFREEAVRKTEAGHRNSEEIAALKSELEKLKKGRAAAAAAKDHLREELDEARAMLATQNLEDATMEGTLTDLESGVHEVVRAFAARRGRKP